MKTYCKALGVNHGKPCVPFHASPFAGLRRCLYCKGFA